MVRFFDSSFAGHDSDLAQVMVLQPLSFSFWTWRVVWTSTGIVDSARTQYPKVPKSSRGRGRASGESFAIQHGSPFRVSVAGIFTASGDVHCSVCEPTAIACVLQAASHVPQQSFALRTLVPSSILCESDLISSECTTVVCNSNGQCLTREAPGKVLCEIDWMLLKSCPGLAILLGGGKIFAPARCHHSGTVVELSWANRFIQAC
jgi:hypothetical protein